eukprot:INCI5289.2.p1 GENE.INCI5289.2~~INCI5289.2.p1  ORF type:complete len:599 (+),score=144.39 INCI5289.2:132-1799(+)
MADLTAAILSAAEERGISDKEALVSFAVGFVQAVREESAEAQKEPAAAAASPGGGAKAVEPLPTDEDLEHVALKGGKPPLDVMLFRDEKLAETVRVSQRRRNPVDELADCPGETEEERKAAQEGQRKKQAEKVALVDQVVDLDKSWREERFKYDAIKKEKGLLSKKIGGHMKKKEIEEANALKAKVAELDDALKAQEALASETEAKRDAFLCQIGNLCPEDRGMVWTNIEEKSPVYKEFGTDMRLNTEENPLPGVLNHIDLFHRLNARDCNPSEAGGPAEGNKVAGGRAYFLRGVGCFLNQALINYALQFLEKKQFTAMHCPFFIRQSMMGLAAQLEDFDEQLYKVTGEGEDKYLIATSEQALCCYHADARVDRKDLPIRIAGYSSCFRKEVGSHGRDTLGIFRVHQFEKVEQFCVTEPDKSWEMMEEMIGNSMEFYESLNIPYKVINIVSGELNNAAAQKFDLEAWFPASRCYRELVSCSNCLDYQSRRLQTKIAGKDGGFVHMLNSTLSATERALCCIVENNQTPEGVKVHNAYCLCPPTPSERTDCVCQGLS